MVKRFLRKLERKCADVLVKKVGPGVKILVIARNQRSVRVRLDRGQQKSIR